MIDNHLTDDLLTLLTLIDKVGSTVCTGTCEHRKPGELHCLTISNLMKISSTGVKNRLRNLVLMGYLNRDRVEREDGKVMGQYTLSEKGLNLLTRSKVKKNWQDALVHGGKKLKWAKSSKPRIKKTTGRSDK